MLERRLGTNCQGLLHASCGELFIGKGYQCQSIKREAIVDSGTRYIQRMSCELQNNRPVVCVYARDNCTVSWTEQICRTAEFHLKIRSVLGDQTRKSNMGWRRRRKSSASPAQVAAKSVKTVGLPAATTRLKSQHLEVLFCSKPRLEKSVVLSRKHVFSRKSAQVL